MKSKTLISIFLLLCVIFLNSCTKVHLRTHNHRRVKISPDNIYVKIMDGCTEHMAGNVKDVESCLPADWKSEAATETSSSASAFEGVGDVLIIINKYLGESMDETCKFAPDVKAFFKKKAGVRRYRKVFVELKKVHGRKGAFDDIAPHTQTLFQKIKDLMNSPLVLKIIEVMNCMKAIKTTVVGYINTVTNFEANRTKMISGLSGFIDVLINMVCKWKDFRDAINFLSDGLKATDNVAKWGFYGKFFGKLVSVIGSS